MKRVGQLIGVVVAAMLLAPATVLADDCSGAFDCFQSVSAGALFISVLGASAGLFWGIFRPGGTRDQRGAASGQQTSPPATAAPPPETPPPPLAALSEPPSPKIAQEKGLVRPDGSRIRQIDFDDGWRRWDYYDRRGDRSHYIVQSPDEARIERYDNSGKVTERVVSDGGLKTTYTPGPRGSENWASRDAAGTVTQRGTTYSNGAFETHQTTETGVPETTYYDSSGRLFLKVHTYSSGEVVYIRH